MQEKDSAGPIAAVTFLDELAKTLPPNAGLIVSHTHDLKRWSDKWHEHSAIYEGEFCITNTHLFNVYTSVMAVKPRTGATKPYRAKTDFAGGMCFLIDDIGSGPGAKYPLSLLDPLPPTTLIETSPNNYQAVYFFTEAITNVDHFECLIDAFIVRHYEGKDTGQKGVYRIFRLPVGVNTKPKYKRDDGSSPPVRLAQWNPHLKYDPQQIVDAFDLRQTMLDLYHGKQVLERAYNEQSDDDAMSPDEKYDLFNFTVNKLYQLNKISLADINSPELRSSAPHYRIICPWSDSHTTQGPGLDEAKFIFPNAQNHGFGKFKCHHAHCEGYKASDIRRLAVTEQIKAFGVDLDFTDEYWQSLINKPDLIQDIEPDIIKLENPYNPPIIQQVLVEDKLHPLIFDDDAIEYGEPQESIEPVIYRHPDVKFSHEYINDINQPDWIVKGLISRKSITFLFGASFTGKSFFALELAALVQNGLPAYEMRTKQTNVMYVAAEGAISVKNRIWAMHVDRHFEKSFLVYPKKLDILARKCIDGSADAISYENNLQEAEKLIRAHHVGLIIIDTLSASLHTSMNENDNGDMANLITHLYRFTERTNTAVIILHHSGKGESGAMRGASALFANVDSVLKLDKPMKGDGKVIIEKNKFGVGGVLADFSIKGDIELFIDVDGDMVSGAYMITKPHIENLITDTDPLILQIVEAEKLKEEKSVKAYIIRAFIRKMELDTISDSFSGRDINEMVDALCSADNEKLISEKTKNNNRSMMVNEEMLRKDGIKFSLNKEHSYVKQFIASTIKQ